MQTWEKSRLWIIFTGLKQIKITCIIKSYKPIYSELKIKIYLQFFHFNYNKPFSNNLANISKLKVKYKRAVAKCAICTTSLISIAFNEKKTDNQFFIN